jgi:hypothetical protein
LPEDIRKFTRSDAQNVEIWYYYSAGIAIRFIGETRDKDFYFKPDPAKAER